jgi:hypothetical protein
MPKGRPCSEANVVGCIKDNNPRGGGETSSNAKPLRKGRPCSEANVVGCTKDQWKNASGPTDDGPSCGWSIRCMVTSAAYTLFGGQRGWITAPYLRWLIRVPNIAGSDGAVADAATVTRAAGLALLLGLVTFSLFYYYALGLMSHGGGGAIMDGITRSVSAALFILAWPWLYENGVALADTLSDALVPGAQMEAITVELLAIIGGTALFTGPGALLVAIVISVAFALLILALFIMKLGLTVGLCLAYLAAPIAVALWAIPATAQPAGYVLRYCAAAASTMVTQALCLMAAGAVNKDVALFSGGGAWTDQVQKPLFGLAMLAAMLAMPRHTFRAWGLGGEGGRTVVGHATSLMGDTLLRNAMARSIPGGLGGRGSVLARVAEHDRQRGGGIFHGGGVARDAEQGQRRSREASDQQDAGGRRRGRAGGQSAAQSARQRAYRVAADQSSAAPPRAQPDGRRAGSAGGGQRRPGDVLVWPLNRDGGRGAEARMTALRGQGVSAGALGAAFDTVARAGHGPRLLEMLGNGGGGDVAGGPRDVEIAATMAQASTKSGLGAEYRDALLTIGAATPEVRGQVLRDWRAPAAGHTSAPQPEAEPSHSWASDG